jgi:hypothetical protein
VAASDNPGDVIEKLSGCPRLSSPHERALAICCSIASSWASVFRVRRSHAALFATDRANTSGVSKVLRAIEIDLFAPPPPSEVCASVCLHTGRDSKRR